jgi:hypothetical protein
MAGAKRKQEHGATTGRRITIADANDPFSTRWTVCATAANP